MPKPLTMCVKRCCGQAQASLFGMLAWVGAALLMAAVMLSACGNDDNSLSTGGSCSTAQDCPGATSCYQERCVRDGSISLNAPCSDAQCMAGTICNQGLCIQGCRDLYYSDSCGPQSFCKPPALSYIPGQTPGTCSPGECEPDLQHPAGGTGCSTTQSACVAVTANIGACVPACTYGLVGQTYRDDCAPPSEEQLGPSSEQGSLPTLACAPLGLGQAPVCLPSGELQPGDVGCDATTRPCAPGSVCVQVVCRQMCNEGSAEAVCQPGEVCVPHAGRADVAYCRVAATEA